MRVVTESQRSDEWTAARVGMLTASRAADMMATIKSGEAAARRDLRLQLVCERLTGVSQEDGYISPAMQRGVEKEADAFAAYEALTGEMARKCGFLAHDDLLAGCSPDGVIGPFVGLIECKCPKSATHLSYLRAKTVPRDYLLQITHQLWVTGAGWCDFVSFDDRFQDPLRLFVKRVHRTDVDISAYELAVRLFLGEVETELESVRALGLAGAAA
jgi:predicted phage-related endonuclease